MSHADSGVSVNPLALDAGFRRDESVAPPDMTFANDITLVSFEAWQRTGAHAMQACFRTTLSHGFSREEIAPLIFDKLAEIARKKMRYTSIAPGTDVAPSPGPGLRREAPAELAGLYPTVLHGIVIYDLAFTPRDELYACVDACTYRDACESAVRAPRFSGELAEVPAPSIGLATLLAAVHHPTHAISIAAVAFTVASVVAIATRRRPRR